MTGRQRNKLVPSTEEERAVPSKRDQVASSHLRSPAGQRKKASFAGSGVKVADASPQEELALYCDANPFFTCYYSIASLSRNK
jgi:hypothetical protein